MLVMAAASLLGPFLRELTSSTDAAIDTIAEDTGQALRGCAARVWRSLFGCGGEASGETVASAPSPEFCRPATEKPDPRLVEAVQERMQTLDADALATLEATLRDAERNGGPHVGRTWLDQDVRGNRNVTIGQNTGNVTISGG